MESDQSLAGLCFVIKDDCIVDVPVSEAGSTTLVVPHGAQNQDWDTIACLANPNSVSALVKFYFRNQNGELVSRQGVRIQHRRGMVRFFRVLRHLADADAEAIAGGTKNRFDASARRTSRSEGKPPCRTFITSRAVACERTFFRFFSKPVGEPGPAGEKLHRLERKRNRRIDLHAASRYQHQPRAPVRVPNGELQRGRSPSRHGHRARLSNAKRVQQRGD